MNWAKIDKLHELRGGNPKKALLLQKELGSSFVEQQVKAEVLIDAGSLLNDFDAVNEGVEILKGLKSTSTYSSENAFNLATGLQVRAWLTYKKSAPHTGQSFQDRFEARLEFGHVMKTTEAFPKIKSQASTNIGILLLETSRWVEALDYFKHALDLFPTNSVAAFQEMRYLMSFCDLRERESERYGSYTHIASTRGRIKSLATLIDENYDIVEEFSGPQSLESVRNATEDALKLSVVTEKPLSNEYFNFIRKNDIALSLYPSFEQYESGKFDLLSLRSISFESRRTHEVPEIFAMINIIKSDYAFARQIFYEARYEDRETMFHETSPYHDRLDYALYGVQFSALTTAQRIAFDVLDKIAVALAVYFEIPRAEKTDFIRIWGSLGENNSFVIRPKIEAELLSGNFGLNALYNLYTDITQDKSRGNGFLEAHKRFRNSTTHRFTVLHDETFKNWNSTSNSMEHESIEQFERLTLMSLKLVKAAMFYFVDTINFCEDKKPKSELSVQSIVPSHDYIRGKT